jgi:hypothetical protein
MSDFFVKLTAISTFLFLAKEPVLSKKESILLGKKNVLFSDFDTPHWWKCTNKKKRS